MQVVSLVCLCFCSLCTCFFFQAEDGIRGLVRSRGLGDVYKRQALQWPVALDGEPVVKSPQGVYTLEGSLPYRFSTRCLLYTSDAADDLLCVDLGGRRIIKKKKHQIISQ